MLLITGATGYLGSALVEVMVRRGFPVRATVRSPERAAVLPSEVERVPADLADEESLVRAMEGCEAVFHLAASLGATPGDTHEANVEGTRRVLSAARRAGVQRVVHTSSSAAIIAASGLVSERTTGGTALVDPYSTTKEEAERLVLDAARNGLHASIVNVTNAYGPSPLGPRSYNALLLAAVRGEAGPVVDAPVGWVLAEDVALGHLLAWERGEPGRRYLLCGEVASFSTVLNRTAELWGSPHRVQALPPGTTLPPDALPWARRSEVYGKLGPVRIDDAQARALGFQPRGIDEGLGITVDWLRTVT
jgi:dihydroflavonol-4-reductase